MKFWYHLVVIKIKTLAIGIWQWPTSEEILKIIFMVDFLGTKVFFLQFRLPPLAPLDSPLSVLGYVLYVHILLVEFWEGVYRTMLKFFVFSLEWCLSRFLVFTNRFVNCFLFSNIFSCNFVSCQSTDNHSKFSKLKLIVRRRFKATANSPVKCKQNQKFI